MPIATTPFRQRVQQLTERTYQFAATVRLLAANAPKVLTNVDDLKQVIRSSGSVAANYLEADEAMSKRDFIKCIKICRKEARESQFWLRQIRSTLPNSLTPECRRLEQEAYALVRIFNACIQTSKSNLKQKKHR